MDLAVGPNGPKYDFRRRHTCKSTCGTKYGRWPTQGQLNVTRAVLRVTRMYSRTCLPSMQGYKGGTNKFPQECDLRSQSSQLEPTAEVLGTSHEIGCQHRSILNRSCFRQQCCKTHSAALVGASAISSSFYVCP